MENQQNWLSTAEALALLRITSRTTLYKFAYKYRIKVCKPLGRRYYYRPDIIDRLDAGSAPMSI